MITFYTMLKPFKGYIGVIQKNAIKSWTLLRPECEIIMFGNEEGVAEAASEFGAIHVPTVKRNEYGTALLSDVFSQAEKLASNDMLCFINADIILMNDFVRALDRVKDIKGRYLMSGRRRNVDIKELLDFSDGWEDRLRAFVNVNGKLVHPNSMDFFVFHKGFWGEIPPFSIGRPRYDNWMIYTARYMGKRVIDATPVVMSVHQNHDYYHIPSGINNTWEGPEAEVNKDLYGRDKLFYTLSDANWIMTKKWLRPNINSSSLDHIIRKRLGIGPSIRSHFISNKK